MPDLLSESAVPIKHAPSLVPGRPHISTIWRWVLKGVRGVKLETFVSGGRRFTTHQAIERFIAATTAAADGVAPSVPSVNKRRAAEIAAAEARCAAVGI